MASLTFCDIYRDGGSLAATVLDGDRHLSFWLQTNFWNHPRDAGHENLFISDGDNPQAKTEKLGISSNEEHQWLNYLLQVNDTDVDADAKRHFRDLIAVLQSR